MHQPGYFHFDGHVCHGPRPVLPRHLPVVHHLEYCFLHWQIVFIGPINPDALNDIYARLPKRIYAKLLATKDMEVKYKPKVSSFVLLYGEILTDPIKVLVSQIWNAIIILMYRKHLSIDHVQKLLYHQVDKGASGRSRWKLTRLHQLRINQFHQDEQTLGSISTPGSFQ